VVVARDPRTSRGAPWATRRTAPAGVGDGGRRDATGRAAAGCGYHPVHGWGPGWIQDLRGGKQGNAAIMALSPDYAYLLDGSAWHDYQAQAGPDTGPRAGYPTSEPYRCGDSTMFELADGSAGPGVMVTTTSHRYIWLTGDVWTRYDAIGGPAGRLGSPTGTQRGIRKCCF